MKPGPKHGELILTFPMSAWPDGGTLAMNTCDSDDGYRTQAPKPQRMAFGGARPAAARPA